MKKLYIILTISFLCVININVMAFAVNPEIANIGYWYEDQDVRGVITNRLGSRAYIAPAAPNVSELINDIAKAAIVEARFGKPALIPVNLRNNHWTSLAIRKRADGTLVVFYNDSFGDGVSGAGSESNRYIEAIKAWAPNAQIIDLQVKQQNDGSSCGVFTAENLIAIAELREDQLNEQGARTVLAGIKEAGTLRLLHLNGLSHNARQNITLKEDAASSVNIKENIEGASMPALYNKMI